MLRPGLVRLVAKRDKTHLLGAELVVEAIFDCLKDALSRGEHIEIRGLGSFHVRSYKGYKGRNPKTGESIQVKPKRLPYFKPSKTFSGRINRFPTKPTRANEAGQIRKERKPPPTRQPFLPG
jgi:integration host factor subunit beta